MPEFLKHTTDQIQLEFNKYAIKKSFKKGVLISAEGMDCQFFPIVSTGKIRVFKEGTTNREINIYRINPGESCILTISCILSQKQFPAQAEMEEAGEIYLIPADIFRLWVDRHEFWKKYAFELVNRRLVIILENMQNLAFKRMDVRIAEYLLSHQISADTGIHTTHQNLANDLGSVREVVSRILKEFENKGFISLSRGKIFLLNPIALKKIAEN